MCPKTEPYVLKESQLDRVAIILSGLCLVHCLALPVALVLGSVFSDWLVATETNAHWILLGLAAPTSIWALGRGFRAHRSHLTLGLVGVSHIAGESWEIALTVIGVTAVLIAHIRNALARKHAHH
jgi:hypothetical protein